MIPFNRPCVLGSESGYLEKALEQGKLCGDGPFTRECHAWLQKNTGTDKVLLTTSGTTALEMAAILADVGPGDEIIMPSYTFVSTANAFVLRGAVPVFVDIRPDTLNLDETLVEAALTARTKAIVPVHYAGVSCAMDVLSAIAARHGLLVIEDAAQGVMSRWRDRALGAIGDLGCYSFHETKNYTMGEGGALLVNRAAFAERAEIIREKGTNRSQFFRGQVDKYTWVDVGGSFLPADLNAACLFAQLEQAEMINADRLGTWNYYHERFGMLAGEGLVTLPTIPSDCTHNAHMYAIRVADLSERTALIDHLRQEGVQAVFHYVPLHSAPAGRRFGRFHGEDRFTTKESERLLRLPLWYGMERESAERVAAAVSGFFGRSST